ncbi:class I SAM-dependent methyltransferase [Mycobacterium yunnanensis]|uniref:Class I SAM-dependent methyltransferase n=1 Tax=Mycobacterium yunnanensis TaxID=368477 RepID=A0A9X2Z5J8_9MYCO|nr:class I SAM-dependent methyltransferase [Mycobacterium yunnanensis]MCV7423805.1 class I SAM-dependent methyltransferase [Mycobacterium yunnanensis]
MFGDLYERALAGERCFIRNTDGRRTDLPLQRWLGNHPGDAPFDDAVLAMCDGPTLELGCGPARLITRLTRRGVPALGVDRSPRAVALARLWGAPALCADVFEPLPGIGLWRTVLLVDGNIGLAGDPLRILRRCRDMLAAGGNVLVEFDAHHHGATTMLTRLETDERAGPWFPWATVGVDHAEEIAERAGLRLKDIQVIGDRALASMAWV